MEQKEIIEVSKIEPNYSKMDDKELICFGFGLMKMSLRNIFNKDAQEHKDYEAYCEELERRGLLPIENHH